VSPTTRPSVHPDRHLGSCRRLRGRRGRGRDGCAVGTRFRPGLGSPGSYSDNATLDPYQDLEFYEVYVRQDRNFNDNDLPVALIKAVIDDPTASAAGKRLETEFILDNLGSFVSQGKLYYVSVKAVGVDGQKSAFMAPVSWDRRTVLPI